METTVTSKGQVTIPKRLRDSMHLDPGSKVTFEINKDGEAVLRKCGSAERARPDKFERALGSAEIKLGCSTDEYMAMIRVYDDDDPGLRKSIRMALETMNHKVTEARDAAEAHPSPGPGVFAPPKGPCMTDIATLGAYGAFLGVTFALGLGLPAGIPLLDTETNDHGGEAAVDIFGALWLADSFGGFLAAGGQSTHYYHDLPYSPPHPACANSWGTYHMFMVDDHYQIQQKTSQFYGAQLITQEWAEPKDAEHSLFPAVSDVKDKEGHVLVTAYALERPDGQWSVMLINKDYDQPHQVRIVFHNSESNREDSFSGRVTMITFGKAQYQWHPDRKKGHADPDTPPVKVTLTGGENTMYTLPAASLTILRGKR